jgi:hypothetical protein
VLLLLLVPFSFTAFRHLIVIVFSLLTSMQCSLNWSPFGADCCDCWGSSRSSFVFSSSIFFSFYSSIQVYFRITSCRCSFNNIPVACDPDEIVWTFSCSSFTRPTVSGFSRPVG